MMTLMATDINTSESLTVEVTAEVMEVTAEKLLLSMMTSKATDIKITEITQVRLLQILMNFGTKSQSIK
jgi:hypothetical protein